MVITCASCETRFQVADGRIPVKGAWVRCSRCHHRFLVTPSSDADASQPEYEDSALEESGGSTETDLDNPQFLFERNETPPAEAGDSVDSLQLEGTATPAPPRRERPSPDGADLALGDEDPLAGLDAEIDEEREGDSFEALTPPLGQDDLGSAEQSFAGIAADECPTKGAGKGPDLSSLPDLDDEPDDSWDTMTAMEVPSSAGSSAFDRAESAPKRESSAPSPAAPELSPRRADLESFTLRVLAVVVAVALSAGGVRAVALHGLGEVAGPETVESDGWQAAELEAYNLRDDSGRPVLVVRGKLYRNGRAAPPRVLATLLDPSGRPIGDATAAALVRLDDEELSPTALGQRLVGYDDWVRSEIPAIVRGFTVLVPEPPLRARRYRLELVEPPA